MMPSARNAAVTSSARSVQIRLHAVMRNADGKRLRSDSLKNIELSGICHSITDRFIPVSGKARGFEGFNSARTPAPAAVTIGGENKRKEMEKEGIFADSALKLCASWSKNREERIGRGYLPTYYFRTSALKD